MNRKEKDMIKAKEDKRKDKERTRTMIATEGPQPTIHLTSLLSVIHHL